MKQMFSTATVMWDEKEIIRRENLIREIPSLLLRTWHDLNSAVYMERIETPILTPALFLSSHIDANFELISTADRGYLRPETTAGTYEAMNTWFPHEAQIKKKLPMCLWQVGLSFRDEKKSETMRASKLRLVQFYQMEFQLFASEDTKAPYLEKALDTFVSYYGGEYKPADELPHYSEKTLDWYIDGLEVAGCSIRKDWGYGKVFEVAIGLDRLVALQMRGK
jgi:glycyl-tRNA synthetase (class II)